MCCGMGACITKLSVNPAAKSDRAMIVTFADIQACQFCSRGARAWFKDHGFDYLDFVRNGIDADILIQTNDAFAARAVEQAKTRLGGDDGRQ